MAETCIERQEYKDFSLGIHLKGTVIKAQLELTYRCNLHCVHCYTDPYNKPEFFPKELSTPEIKRILDELADYGVFWLNLTGGEVFMRKDFFELYDYAFRKGLVVSLYTNGTCFRESAIERLKLQPPFFIDVSCHSVREADFDRFTQVPGSFRKFMKGMSLLAASGLPFRLKTKAMNWNKDEIKNIRNYVQGLGLPFGFTTNLAPRLDGDVSSLDYRLAPDEIEKLETEDGTWREDEETCRQSRSELREPTDALYRCGCGTDSIHISAWGELGACTHEYETRASLRSMRLGEAVEKVFNQIRSYRFMGDSPCGTCRIHTFCERSPSPTRWETGDREKPVVHHCDTALHRAQRLTGQRLEHPLREKAGRKT